MYWRLIKNLLFLTLGISITIMLLKPPAYKPPDNQDLIRAIGATDHLPPPLKKAFDLADFTPMGPAKPPDWLFVYPEPGQTYDQYLRLGPNLFRAPRNKMYLQPLGEFPADQSPPIEALREFTSLYFGAETIVLPMIPLASEVFSPRMNGPHRQILSPEILDFLKSRVPPDAYCILGITMEDLYPEASWNFVFGQASLRDRTGVFSFARYDPAFYNQTRTSEYQNLILKRSCKVLAHEAAHMFGLYHCVFFDCLINGSNHLRESDSRPIHLCPVCLRKLMSNVGFDVIQRYRGLETFYRSRGFTDDADWISRRLKKIGS